MRGKLGDSSRLDVGENERVPPMLPSFSFLVGLSTYQHRGIEREVVNVSEPSIFSRARARHALTDRLFHLMHSVDVNTMGSETVYSIL